jgi:hypothetical protein
LRRHEVAPVFENSTANVLRVSRTSDGFGRSGAYQHLVAPVLTRERSEWPLSSELKVKRLPAGCFNQAGNHFFTESLILAQDERWRRA